MVIITDARLLYKTLTGGALLLLPAIARAQEACPSLPNPVYGAGGSAVTATLGAVATELAKLPDDTPGKVNIFYWDPGACRGYDGFIGASTTADDRRPPFKYWDATGVVKTCRPTADVVLDFAHMGNTPLLCPRGEPLPAGFGKFVAPVQTINLITHRSSQFDAVSAEALYHVYGFGPGAAGRAVAPWTVPQAVFARATNSFVHQVLRSVISVPPTGFKLPPENFVSTNQDTVRKVFEWGNTQSPDQPLGYVSGSAADQGEDRNEVKTLAFKALGQTCAVLPDSSRARKDKLNVRNGSYALWTPAWFYARTTGADITNERVRNLVRWFDGTATPPGNINVTQIVIRSGDVPLCAMSANRAEGDLSPITSYKPARPCNGFFEFTAIGSTSRRACADDGACQASENCSFGYCEAK